MTYEDLSKDTKLRQGYGLASFAAKVLGTAVDATIGEVKESDTFKGKETYTVVGVIKNPAESTVTLLSANKLPCNMDADKFNNADVSSIIDYAGTQLGWTVDDKEKFKSKLEKYRENKLVPQLFNNGTHVKTFVECDKGIKRIQDAEIAGFKYTIDKATLEFNYFVRVRIGEGNSAYEPIDKEGDSWYLGWLVENTDLDTKIRGKNIISFNRFGYANPVKVTGTECDFVVDNCFIYTVNGEEVHIIGNVSSKGFELLPEYNSFESDKTYKELAKRNYAFRVIHQYMMPYGIGELNEV